MKPSPKAIAVLIVIIFLLILSIVVIYSNLIKKQANKIQPTPITAISTPLITPVPIVKDIVIDEPFNGETNIVMGDEYEIKGSSSLEVEFIDLEIINNKISQKIVLLDNFQTVKEYWSFKFEANNNLLVQGKNTIIVSAHRKDNTVGKEEIIINVKKKIMPEVVGVEWYPELIKQSAECSDDGCEATIYKAGIVTNGTYKDHTVYLEISDGFFSRYVAVHYVVEDGQNIYFEDNGITIEGFVDLPKIILSPDNTYSLTLFSFDNYADFSSDLKNIKVLFKDEQMGNVYSVDEGCTVAFIERPDHTTARYVLTIPFDEDDILAVTFTGNKKNTDQYHGLDCEHDFKIQTESELNPNERLKISGIASNGDYIYEFADSKVQELLDLYNDRNTMSYDMSNLEKNKYSYQEFLDLHPILFWKDPLGRWLRFVNTKVNRSIELGKPVIYLYPEKKMKLSVKVAPNGGFIVTDPPYGDGWEVEAEPNGQITDLKTGKKYDYLFWEGIGLDYPNKNLGWVVEKEDLENFFVEKLSTLGLNENEITEFNEYWVKKLSETPYYKIYFLTQNEFNKIAPLAISPQAPQTLIRVMMIAEGLVQSEKVPEQKLSQTPIRKGFTAVEWGGALLR